MTVTQSLPALPAFFNDPTRACNGADPELFFPGSRANTAQAAARAICSRCPFQHDCAEYAIPHAGLHGVWGGTSFKERQRIRQRRGAT